MSNKKTDAKKESSQSWNLLKGYFLKNNFVLVFNILALISLIFSLAKTFDFSVGLTSLNQLISLFSVLIWFFLTVSFILSGLLAFYNKKTLMFIPILIWLLTSTVLVRTANIPNLKNIATGELELGPDLDPYLYLRNVREIVEMKNLGQTDLMRYAPLGAPSYIYSSMMPWAIYSVYKISSVFTTEMSIIYAAIISPVIFFVISLMLFFGFVYTLFSFKLSKEKSLLGATLASFFYSFVPAMLHRTIAGIPELESLGMIWFWLTFLFFCLAWKKEKVKSWMIYGILAGLSAGAMAWSWGGYKYIYMVISFAALSAFFFNVSHKKNLVIFACVVISGILVDLFRTKSIISMLTSITDYGFAAGVLFVLLINFVLFETKLKNLNFVKRISDKIKIPKNIISILLAAVLGILILILLKPTFIVELLPRVIEGFLKPFGEGRVGLTVAENRAPYFLEALESFGGLIWIFLAGVILIFCETVGHFEIKKRFVLNFSFIIFILTFVFSRISSTHLLNGENAISKLLYFGGLILFTLTVLIIYLLAGIRKDKKTIEDFSKIDLSSLLLISFSFWAIVSMRGAVRLFFIIAPMIILAAVYFLIKIFDYLKTKDELLRLIVFLGLIASMIVSSSVLMNYAISTVSSAPYVAPSSYNQQWQYAMNWVSNNTPENSVFVHWWDYGYWVQTMGKRPTVTDGGHFTDWWDHTTGRYLLTTPYPETALSLMKTHNVSYLLIDSSDLGKYGAYSSIGSGRDGSDRIAEIPVAVYLPEQSQETNGTKVRIYQGATFVDEDIVYENEGGVKIFLPQGKAYFVGLITKTIETESTIQFTSAPEAVYYYNNKQISIPVRYAYFDDKIIDFGKGINAIIRIVPSLVNNNENIYVERLGAAIYLSNKVSKSLFAQLYLMNDPFKKYSTIKLAHSEDDFLVKNLKQQNINLGDLFYYQGLRGPIKIWKVDYPENTITHQEFLDVPEGWNQRDNASWGLLDNFNFTS